jgi:hypothetical protein
MHTISRTILNPFSTPPFSIEIMTASNPSEMGLYYPHTRIRRTGFLRAA